ncbi:hypothetical protein BH11PSE2_BH11PSE2_09900 [soil metagenome]
MPAQAKGRGDVGPVNRRAQQEAADVLAQFVEELRLLPGRALVAVEAHSALGLEVVGLDLGIAQVAALDGLAAVGDLAVEDHAEAVAGLDVAREVELIGEQVGDLAHLSGRRARGLGRLVEAAVDGAAGDLGLVTDLLFHLTKAQGAVHGPRKGQGGDRICLHRKAEQAHGTALIAWRGDGDLDLLAGDQVFENIEMHRLGHDGGRFLGLAGIDAGAADDALKGLAGADLDGDGLGRFQSRAGASFGEGFVLENGGRLAAGRADQLGADGRAAEVQADEQSRDAGHADEESRRQTGRRTTRIKLLQHIADRPRCADANRNPNHLLGGKQIADAGGRCLLKALKGKLNLDYCLGHLSHLAIGEA